MFIFHEMFVVEAVEEGAKVVSQPVHFPFHSYLTRAKNLVAIERCRNFISSQRDAIVQP